VIAIISAFFATGVVWINAFGPFGWIMAGLVGFVLTTAGLYLTVSVRGKMEMISATRKWRDAVDIFNPMDKQIDGKRIAIRDLMHPAHSFVNDKTITNCQLVGPATILLMSGTVDSCGFLNCDLVRIKDETMIYSAVAFKECILRKCEFINCTVLVPDNMFDAFKSVRDVNFITKD